MILTPLSVLALSFEHPTLFGAAVLEAKEVLLPVTESWSTLPPSYKSSISNLQSIFAFLRRSEGGWPTTAPTQLSKYGASGATVSCPPEEVNSGPPREGGRSLL
jgi:hypothetical protein